MTRPKWSNEKERVYRAAMRWAKYYNCFSYPRMWCREFELRLDKACAAASKRGKP